MFFHVDQWAGAWRIAVVLDLLLLQALREKGLRFQIPGGGRIRPGTKMAKLILFSDIAFC